MQNTQNLGFLLVPSFETGEVTRIYNNRLNIFRNRATEVD